MVFRDSFSDDDISVTRHLSSITTAIDITADIGTTYCFGTLSLCRCHSCPIDHLGYRGDKHLVGRGTYVYMSAANNISRIAAAEHLVDGSHQASACRHIETDSLLHRYAVSVIIKFQLPIFNNILIEGDGSTLGYFRCYRRD